MKEIRIEEVKIEATVVFRCPECERKSSVHLSNEEATRLIFLPTQTMQMTCYSDGCHTDFKIKL